MFPVLPSIRQLEILQEQPLHGISVLTLPVPLKVRSAEVSEIVKQNPAKLILPCAASNKPTSRLLTDFLLT